MFIVFFLNLKTAYEMRISDWSSDVCSSDLAAAIAEAAQRFHDLHMQQYAHAERHSTPEIVTLRLAAVGRLAKPRSRPYVPSADAAAERSRRIRTEARRVGRGGVSTF